MTLPRLLPAGTLSAILGVPIADLRHAADNGEIPCVRVGKRGLLFDRELVERVLLARAAGEGPDQRSEYEEPSDPRTTSSSRKRRSRAKDDGAPRFQDGGAAISEREEEPNAS